MGLSFSKVFGKLFGKKDVCAHSDGRTVGSASWLSPPGHTFAIPGEKMLHKARVTLLTNCLTHALPRRLPTPTEEADGNGYGAIAGRGGPSRPPPRVGVNLVPLLLTGVSLHPPRRTDKNLCRCFGAPVRRVFPDHPDH